MSNRTATYSTTTTNGAAGVATYKGDDFAAYDIAIDGDYFGVAVIQSGGVIDLVVGEPEAQTLVWSAQWASLYDVLNRAALTVAGRAAS